MTLASKTQQRAQEAWAEVRLEEATLTSPCLLTDKVAEAQQECLCLLRTPHRAAGLGAGQWEGSSDRNMDLCLSFSWGLGVGRGWGLSTDLRSSPGCHLPVVDCISSLPGDFSCVKWGWAWRTMTPQYTLREWTLSHGRVAGVGPAGLILRL